MWLQPVCGGYVEQAADERVEALGQLLVEGVLVLGEARHDAAERRRVEERHGRMHHRGEHGVVQRGGGAQLGVGKGAVAPHRDDQRGDDPQQVAPHEGAETA